MQPFEYVVVLTSLILGLGISQILIGLSDTITNYKNVKLSWPHTCLVAVIFMIQIQEWYIDYQYSKSIDIWTLPMVISLLIYPTLLFLNSRILFPPLYQENEKVDLDKYYYDKWPLFFCVGLAAVLVSMWQNVVISHIPLMEQLPQWGYALSYSVFLVFKIRSKPVHIAFQSLQFLFWIVYLATQKTAL